MSIPFELRKAGQIFDAAGIQGDTPDVQLIQTANPEPNPIRYVEQMGSNADFITGNPLVHHLTGKPGGLGMPMNDEFQSSLDARDRLNFLREYGAY